MRFGELSDDFYGYYRRWKRNSDEFIKDVLTSIDQSSHQVITHAMEEEEEKDSLDQMINTSQLSNNSSIVNDDTIIHDFEEKVDNWAVRKVELNINFRYFSYLMFHSPHVVIQEVYIHHKLN